jgi:hypothetical protein
MAERTFFWDFPGPRGEGTARHFRKHLDEFLHREAVAGCTTGVEELARGSIQNWAAWCRAPAEVAEVVQRALKPRRYRDEPEGTEER